MLLYILALQAEPLLVHGWGINSPYTPVVLFAVSLREFFASSHFAVSSDRPDDGPKLCQHPIGNVLASAAAIFGVSVKGEVLHPRIAIDTIYLTLDRFLLRIVAHVPLSIVSNVK